MYRDQCSGVVILICVNICEHDTHLVQYIYIYIYIYRVVWMHLLAPNVTSVYTIGESIFPTVLDLMNPHSES